MPKTPKIGQVWKREWNLYSYHIKIGEVSGGLVYYDFHEEDWQEKRFEEPILEFLSRFSKVSVEQTVMDI